MCRLRGNIHKIQRIIRGARMRSAGDMLYYASVCCARRLHGLWSRSCPGRHRGGAECVHESSDSRSRRQSQPAPRRRRRRALLVLEPEICRTNRILELDQLAGQL